MSDYISTRGKAPRLSFAEVTLTGLAADGGLYVPAVSPKIVEGVSENLSYSDLAGKVIQPFVAPDFTAEELQKMIRAAYQNFEHKDIVPLQKMDDRLFIMELFHGPTLAFKDVALQFLGHVFDAILARKQQKVTIVAATSGDTGSAAIEAFRDKKNVNIFVLHPHNRVSDVQRRQMTTVLSPNVFNMAVEGSFDDCQNLVKAMFNDQGFRNKMHLSAVNSINWARILAQMVYYVFAALKIKKMTGKPATFCVPTGNFGNIYAGYAAKKMGAPIAKLISASNRNDILHRFFTTGTMKMESVSPSLSPSMDIQISSNFERLLFDLAGQDGASVAGTMLHFWEKKMFTVTPSILEEVQKTFLSGRKSDEETLATMKKFYQERKYLTDPHTAVGLGVAEDYLAKNKNDVIVSLSTAHPAKFPSAVQKATGIMAELPAHLSDLHQRTEKFKILPADLKKVQAFIEESTG